MTDKIDSSNCEFIKVIEEEDKQDAIMNREVFQDRLRSDSSRSNTFRGRPRYGQEYRGRSRYDSNYRGNYRSNMRDNQRYGRQNYS